jgi:hypothetical protein
MSYKLFLDDYRQPLDCFGYMHARIGNEVPIYLDKDWVIVRNFNEFVACITKRGIPNLISFDHDLANEHYAPQDRWEDYNQWESEQQFSEKTGKDCAKWLCDYCWVHDVKVPKYYIHSMNPIGCENIKSILENFKTRL